MDRAPFELVFFDLGGVLFHVHIERFYKKFSRSSGKSVQDLLNAKADMMSVYRRFECGQMTPENFYRTIKTDTAGLDFQKFHSIYTDIFSIDREVSDIIRQLATRKRVSVISNTDVLHFDHLCRYYPIMNRFEHPTTSFLAQCRKPDRQIFQFALARVGLTAEKALFIDDMAENVAGAETVGIRSELFTNAENLRKYFETYDML
jgi:HAD superfamily hydrolase (TIGR01509 family)